MVDETTYPKRARATPKCMMWGLACWSVFLIDSGTFDLDILIADTPIATAYEGAEKATRPFAKLPTTADIPSIADAAMSPIPSRNAHSLPSIFHMRQIVMVTLMATRKTAIFWLNSS